MVIGRRVPDLKPPGVQGRAPGVAFGPEIAARSRSGVSTAPDVSNTAQSLRLLLDDDDEEFG